MSTIPDHTFDPPLSPRGPRIPQLDPSAFPDLTVTQPEAAALRTSANGVEALVADETTAERLVDKLVRLSPLPDWVDRMVIRYVVQFLAPAIREVVDELETQASAR